jgi:hypothetical protein
VNLFVHVGLLLSVAYFLDHTRLPDPESVILKPTRLDGIASACISGCLGGVCAMMPVDWSSDRRQLLSKVEEGAITFRAGAILIAT